MKDTQRLYYYQVVYKNRHLLGMFFCKATSISDAELKCLVKTKATNIQYTLRLCKETYNNHCNNIES